MRRHSARFLKNLWDYNLEFAVMEIKGLIYTPEKKFEKGVVEYEGGIIRSVSIGESVKLSASEEKQYIIPGLVDIHSHGCKGFDTCDGVAENIVKMAEYEHSVGVTSYFPTTMTYDEETLTRVVKAVSEASKKTSVIKGIYLEGPFISMAKRGAQNPKYVTKPDSAELSRLQSASGSMIKFVAIAPEVEGATEFIKENSGKYALTIAHTEADADTAAGAMESGVRHATHFYNAMPPYTHRAPGVIGAAMDRDDVTVELIGDGVHVHPMVVRNTFRFFGPERICLISDSMRACGMPDGDYSLGGQPVKVCGNLATLEDGTIAGSATNLMDCVRSVVKMGVPLTQAIEAATATPAREAGIFDTVGSLEAGKRADMVVLDSDLKLIEVI